MIRELKRIVDDAGFPVVSWIETRGGHAPQAFGEAAIVCSIKKAEVDTEDGKKVWDLYFVAQGTVRHGSYEEGRPWVKLRGFKSEPADGLYLSPAERVHRDHLLKNMKAGALLVKDHGEVMLADFVGEDPIHINCAVASRVETDKLAVLLAKSFQNPSVWITKDNEAYIEVGVGELRWTGDDRVPVYDPGRKRERNGSLARELWSWVLIVAGFGALAGAVWYFF